MHRWTPIRSSCIGRLLWLSTLALVASEPARAATFIVGSGSGCTHATVQAAIGAAESNSGADTIRVTRSVSHLQQALVIATAQTLAITGGFATCAQASGDGINTTLNGAGGTAAPVVRASIASGGDVSLRNLTIQGGDVGGVNYGGGIYFSGDGTLHIADSGVINNQAGYGGGIYAEGTGTNAELIIGTNVTIASNIAAYSGGGIYIEGMELSMREAGSLVINNHANGSSDTGYGGGILVLSTAAFPAYAYIGGGGVGTGSILANQARYGGGIAVVAAEGSDELAELIMYTSDASRPEQIRGNSASVAGGGLYIRPNQGFSDYSRAIAWFYRVAIDSNSAPDGAAIFVEQAQGFFGFYGGNFRMNTYGLAERGAPADALPCPADQPCGSISGNIARTAAGQATSGAILTAGPWTNVDFGLSDFGIAQAGGVAVSGNQGGRLVHGDTIWTMSLDNLDVHGNQFTQELIKVSGDGDRRLSLRDSTIADNTIGASSVVAIDGTRGLFHRSIIWQPGKTTLSQTGGQNPAVAWMIASEVNSLGGGPAAVVAEPRFIDPARGDYRLRAASPAIDLAPAGLAQERDVEGKPRDQRMAEVPRPAGRVRDVGAYERQSLLPLVLNSDFDVDLNLWATVTSGSISRDATLNASGVASSGAARVSLPSVPQQRVVALTQCIHLPGPGIYRLNGWGRSGIGTAAERDAVILAWEYRSSGGEACNVGPPTLGGDHLLTRASSWVQPSIPATIVVPASEWNFQSSIAVSLVVIDNGLSTPGNVLGWFDGITLTVDGSDVLFANGFDG